MKPIRAIIALSSAYLFIYTLSPQLDAIPSYWTIGLWAFSPVIVLLLVYRVLKHGIPSDKTFEEGYWYEDKGRMSQPRTVSADDDYR